MGVRCRYVGVEEKTGSELFYYFVESERSPDTDPVLLWLTGGPRCSAFSGGRREEQLSSRRLNSKCGERGAQRCCLNGRETLHQLLLWVYEAMDSSVSFNSV